MDRNEQTDLRLHRELCGGVPLRFEGRYVRLMLADPLLVSLLRLYDDNGSRLRRWRSRLRCPSDSDIAGKPAQFAHDFFTEWTALLRPRRNLETTALFPALPFRVAQDPLLVLDLSLQVLDFAFEIFGLGHPMLELLVLAIDNQLRFCPIPAQRLEILELLRLRIHDELGLGAIVPQRFQVDSQRCKIPELLRLRIHHFLRLRAIGQERGESFSELGDLARLMVHDFLDLPTIRQKRVEPDLSRFERRLRAHGLVGASLRFDPCFRQPVGRDQFRHVFLASEQLFEEKSSRRTFRTKSNSKPISIRQFYRQPPRGPLPPRVSRAVRAFQNYSVDENQSFGRQLRFPRRQICANFIARVGVIEEQ